MTNWAFWFMAIQGIWCLGGSIGFFLQGKPEISSIWLLYCGAQIGWSLLALKG